MQKIGDIPNTRADINGEFTDGNVAGGVPPTILPAEWFNTIQRELISVLSAAGITPDSNKFDQVATAVSKLATLGLTGIGIGLPNMSDIANFDWQNFAFTSGANYVTTYNTWINPPAGITYNAGTRVSIRVIYISTVNGPRMGLELTPDTGTAANFKVYKLLCVGAAGSRVFTFNQDWNSANPVPISGGGTGATAAAGALANLGGIGLSQLTGVVGTSSNAKMSVTAASATATFTADELIVQTALGGLQYKLSSFNKTINLANTGVGGMDTGTAPATGFVALYAIYNPTTQVSALLAVNATSALAPEVYGGANMPANYTASALVSVWATTAARLLNIGFQRGRKINIPRIVVITTTTPPSTATSLSLATAVPKNAIEVSGYASIAGASLNSSIIVLSANSNAAGLIQVSAAFSATTNQNIGTFTMTLDVPQAIYWNYSQAGGTLDNTGLSVSTYTF